MFLHVGHSFFALVRVSLEFFFSSKLVSLSLIFLSFLKPQEKVNHEVVENFFDIKSLLQHHVADEWKSDHWQLKRMQTLRLGKIQALSKLLRHKMHPSIVFRCPHVVCEQGQQVRHHQRHRELHCGRGLERE
jgi:hypothetical protein